MRSKEILLALAVVASLSMAGCASAPSAENPASAKQVANVKEDGSTDETYCQTDDDTGSRLSHHTTCNDNSADAQAAARSMQNGGYLGPKGN